jgi:acyl-CoA hydrolase
MCARPWPPAAPTTRRSSSARLKACFESGALPLDVVLMQVSPPDAHGFVSLGTTVDCTLTAARCAPVVIAEVNEQMPRTHGDTFIHVSHISAIVETSRPLLELPPSRSPSCICAWRATWPR